MNSISFKLVSFALSTAALVVMSSTASAQTQTTSTDSSLTLSELPDTAIQANAPAVDPVSAANLPAADFTSSVERAAPAYAPFQVDAPTGTPVTTVDPVATVPTFTPTSGQTVAQSSEQQTSLANHNPNQADAEKLQAEVSDSNQPIASPATVGVSANELMPPTVSTSAASLLTEPEAGVSSEQEDTSVAQSIEDIEPGRTTRGGRSYVGIGGAIGLSGSTGIGQGGFLINSKIGLTRNISFRPSVILGDETDFLLPLSYDFILESADPFATIAFAPYVGGGVAFSTSDEADIGFLLTGGVDFPISQQFVANAAVNAAFFGDETSVGISLGVGYTFGGF